MHTWKQREEVKIIHNFRGMRGKKKSKLLTPLPFTCLANVQPQIQLSQCSETDTYLQDLSLAFRYDSLFSLSPQFSHALLLTATAFQNASAPLYPATDGEGCRCSQLVRNAQMLNRLFPPPWGLPITTEVGYINTQIITKPSH